MPFVDSRQRLLFLTRYRVERGEYALSTIAHVFAAAQSARSENMFLVRHRCALRSADDFDPLFFHSASTSPLLRTLERLRSSFQTPVF